MSFWSAHASAARLRLGLSHKAGTAAGRASSYYRFRVCRVGSPSLRCLSPNQPVRQVAGPVHQAEQVDVGRSVPVENQPVAKGIGDGPHAQAGQARVSIAPRTAEAGLPGQKLKTLVDAVDETIRQRLTELLEINPFAADVGVEVVAAPQGIHAAWRFERGRCLRIRRASRFIRAAQLFSNERTGLFRLLTNSSSRAAGANSLSSKSRRPARMTSLSF